MRTLLHTTHIQAPATTVWQILTATDQYPQWNPFMLSLSGALGVGQRRTVTMRAGKRTMTFHPTVQAFEPGTLLRWRGRLAVPGLFDGEHELRVEPTGSGTSEFTQREAFRGVLVPVMRRLLADTDTAFAAMNTALQARAEKSRDVRRRDHPWAAEAHPQASALHHDEADLDDPGRRDTFAGG